MLYILHTLNITENTFLLLKCKLSHLLKKYITIEDYIFYTFRPNSSSSVSGFGQNSALAQFTATRGVSAV